MKHNLEAWLRLRHAPGVGNKTTARLLKHFASAADIINASHDALSRFALDDKTIAFLRSPQACCDTDLVWQQHTNHHIISQQDPRYPAQLKSLPQAPLVLYVWGDPEFLQQPQLAMVGSRNPTASGKHTAEDFAHFLSQAGITINSGLARGIDAASHTGALQGIAGTVALVAHGLDIIYPAQHQALAADIAANGAVVSEMPIGTAPSRGLFPRRNRIISGLSIGTLVVEAALKSGSLTTARHALEQGREVFAIPGSIHNPLSRGCHQLIRQGAKLVETADDILEELAHNLPGKHCFGTDTTQEDFDDIGQLTKESNTQTLDPDHQKLLKCLQFEPIAIDELVECSGFSAAEVASMLLILELEGSVVSDAGRYSRVV